jgi:hypothetical protein
LRRRRRLDRTASGRRASTISAERSNPISPAISRLPEQPAAARPLSPHSARDRGAAADGRAGSDPRQPDQGGRSPRRQPQHAAEEDSAISIFRCIGPADEPGAPGYSYSQPYESLSTSPLAPREIVAIGQHMLYDCISPLMAVESPRCGPDHQMFPFADSDRRRAEQAPRGCRYRDRPMARLQALAPVAVALALLSRRFLTFVVLTGLTPIVPTHEVVVTFLLINARRSCCCWRSSAWKSGR